MEASQGVNIPQDVIDAGRKADKVDKEQAELFRVMLKTPAWVSYVALLDKRLQARSEALLEPAMSMDNLVGQEYIKGAMRGMIECRDLPSFIIQSIETSSPAETED